VVVSLVMADLSHKEDGGRILGVQREVLQSEVLQSKVLQSEVYEKRFYKPATPQTADI
jgi:hypothetical protein